MQQINRTTNQYTFSVELLNSAGWEIVSNEVWNELLASGWNPTLYTPPYRVSKDTITLRILEANKLDDLIALIGTLPTNQKFLWDNFAWFWSDNQTIISMCQQIGLDSNVILAQDPYL
jgi:hypothetical protein